MLKVPFNEGVQAVIAPEAENEIAVPRRILEVTENGGIVRGNHWFIRHVGLSLIIQHEPGAYAHRSRQRGVLLCSRSAAAHLPLSICLTPGSVGAGFFGDPLSRLLYGAIAT